jgi:protein phosphatase
MLKDEEIRAVLLASPDAEEAAAALVARANAEGGRDNITVLVVQIQQPLDGGDALVA